MQRGTSELFQSSPLPLWDNMTVPELRPEMGFCLQAETTGHPPARWYLNMCSHRLITLPQSHSGITVSKEFILTHGIANMQVPFDMGSLRKLKARADGAKQTCFCVDIVFNPLIVKLFMDDGFCKALEKFRPFVVGLALKRVEESIGAKLNSQTIKLVKGLRYKDGEEGDGTSPRPFTDLPGDEDSFDQELKTQPLPEERGPLIEDLTPGPSKPAVKKGFLNKAKGSLYGEEGSKEGVLPENAGDPMGWMPKRLRQTCKIVDTNTPQWQEQEEKRKSVERQNKEQEDFRNMMLQDLDKWCKKSEREIWEEDLPEAPSSRASLTDAPKSSEAPKSATKPSGSTSKAAVEPAVTVPTPSPTVAAAGPFAPPPREVVAAKDSAPESTVAAREAVAPKGAAASPGELPGAPTMLDEMD